MTISSGQRDSELELRTESVQDPAKWVMSVLPDNVVCVGLLVGELGPAAGTLDGQLLGDLLL